MVPAVPAARQNSCMYVTLPLKRHNDGDAALHNGSRNRYDPFQDYGGQVMKRILLSGVGLLAVIAVAAPALADEPPPPRRAKPAQVTRSAPPPRAAEPARQASSGKSWSGSQLGGSNGSSFANNNFVEPGSYICPVGSYLGRDCYETPFSFNESAPSYTFGGYYGYNIQLGNIVVGVEGDASYKNSKSSVTQISETPVFGVYRYDSFTGTLKQGWDGSVRGRLGVLISPTMLIYGTGGVAFGKVSGSLSYYGQICAGSPCLPTGDYFTTSYTSFSETRVGATGGVGVEMQLFGPWTARLEYRYTDLGKFTKTFPVDNSNCDGCGSPSPGASIELHPTFQTVRFGLSADPSQLLSQLFSGGY